MNLPLIGLIILAFTWVFSQFGSRLPAQRSLLWWGVFLFVTVAAIDPSLFHGVVAALGIQVISNFVLGSLVLFCLLQLIEESASQTKNLRQIREIVTYQASQTFIAQASKKPIRALVILPTWNEEASLPLLKAQIEPIQSQFPDIQFCFVNDGSTDQTSVVLRDRFPGQFCTHAANIGVSGALLTGFKIAQSLGVSWVVQCDSDGQHPISEIPHLIHQAAHTQADLLIGSRYFGAHAQSKNIEASSSLRRAGGKLISFTLRILFRAQAVTDPTSGFRVYSQTAIARFIKQMPDEYPEPELIALASLNGLNVRETFVQMRARAGGSSSLNGLKSAQFMLKVFTALLGVRLRSLLP